MIEQLHVHDALAVAQSDAARDRRHAAEESLGRRLVRRRRRRLAR